MAKAQVRPMGAGNGVGGWHTRLEQLRKKDRTFLSFAILFLVCLYAIVPVYLNGPQMLLHPDTLGAFWSPDSGARFAMIRNWIDHGSLVHLHYPYADLDPTGQIHPLAYFMYYDHRGFTVMYQPLFPLLSGIAYRVFGFSGLTLVPMLCGLGCLLVTYATARRLHLRSRLVMILALGIATPLILYSAVFWDHSALMFLAALVGHWMLRSVQDGSSRSAIIAGGVIGLGICVHEQFLALFAAAWLAALPLLRTHRKLLTGLPIGFVILLLLWCLFNIRIYGTFGGPHLGANALQNSTDHPFSLANCLNLSDYADRAMGQLVGTTLPGSYTAAQESLWYGFLALACSLVLYAFWNRQGEGVVEAAVSLTLAVLAAGLSGFLVLKIRTFSAPAGLFQATPLLIPALGVPWHVRTRKGAAPSRDIYYAYLSRTTSLLLIFLLLNPLDPVVGWGSRYLLTSLPLLALLAVHSLERQHNRLRGRWRGGAIACATVLIGISIFCQATSLLWVRRALAYDQDLSTWIQALSTPILVTDTDLNTRLYRQPKEQARFRIRSPMDEALLVEVLRRMDARDFVFVGTPLNDEAAVANFTRNARPYRVVERHKFLTDYSEPGRKNDLQMTRFVLKNSVPIRVGDAARASGRR